MAVGAALARRFDPRRLRRIRGAALCVRERARFVARELRGTRSLAAYRLRGSGAVVEVRHPLIDMWVLEEVFRFRAYEPPAPAARRLEELGRSPRILDLGGHAGYAALFMLERFPGSTVVSFEPDADSARLLSNCIEANRLEDRWSAVQACAGTSAGAVELVGTSPWSTVADGDADPDPLAGVREPVVRELPFLEGSVLTELPRRQVESRDVFPYLAEADMVKMDAEGAEWDILADPRFADVPAPVIVLEYHPVHGPGGDAEATVRGALADAGYETSEPVRSLAAGVLWAWRPA